MGGEKSIKNFEIDRLKKIEDKYIKKFEGEKFQKEIDKKVTEAEKIIRTYELEIKKGNFEAKQPYEKAIKIYEEIRTQLLEKDWKEQAIIYLNQIKLLNEKLIKDKKLREIEEQKALKRKEYEESIKIKKLDGQLEKDLDRLEKIESKYQKEQEDNNFNNEIAMRVNEADKIARQYEIALRKGNFEEICPYPTIIEIYEEVIEKLIDRGWNNEVLIYKKQIQLYKEKLEKDRKLRAIEELKAKKQKEFEDQFLMINEGGMEAKAQRLKALGERDEIITKEEEFKKEITEMVNKAEEMSRNYEIALRKGEFEKECPYSEIIEIYTNIYQRLKEKQWINEALIYSNQIKIYQQKLENDNKLREYEAQKEIKSKRIEELLKTKPSKTKDIERLHELEIKKIEKEKKTERAFGLIDEAENLVKEYELRLKLNKEILVQQSPYEKAISLYREARKIFKNNGWDKEANQLINTINFYKEKELQDSKLREIEKRKFEKEQIFTTFTKPITNNIKKERKKIVSELEEKKKRQEQLSNQAFQIIDEAERLAKEYEIILKEGRFPDCPYEKIIEIYRNARKIFEDIGWDTQANSLIETINYYKEKTKSDLNLRALEAKKIEEQKKEEEEQERIIKKLREKQERESKLREAVLLEKSEKERELEKKKFKAFNFMDQAKRQLIQDNFDLAIELYKESEKIFSEIDWAEGLKMVKESILLINKKKLDSEQREKSLKEEEAERLRLEKELEDEISKSKELERLQEQLKREEMLRIQKQKEKESQASETAYSLLEEGTLLFEKKKFQEAKEKYITAQEVFKELEWFHEVNRINNELLVNLQIEEIKHKRIEEYKKKKSKEKQKLEDMLLEAEKVRKEQEELKIKEKRAKLVKSKVSEKLKEKIEESLARANIEVQNGRYNKSVLKFREIIKMMERIGWENEIIEVKNQLHILEKRSHVPLITLENINKETYSDKFKAAYRALDNAQVSLLKNRIMRSISELNEAKFNLEETKIDEKYIKQIDAKLEELKDIIRKKQEKEDISDIGGIEIEKDKPLKLSSDLAYEYMDKCKKEERRNNYSKAIKFANIAKEIFAKLGAEWAREIMTITRYISILENKEIARAESFKRRRNELDIDDKSLKEEEEEFRKRIIARREERAKRIKNLINDKK